MNIAIDVTPLQSEHAKRGVGIYTKFLIEYLELSGSKHKFLPIKKGEPIPRETDVVHYPYFDPFFLTLPLAKPKPTVVTVHDLIPIVFPDKFPRGVRGAIKWQIQKISLQGAKRIIADSQTSKKDITRLTGFSSLAIDAIYLGPTLEHTKSPSASSLGDFFQKHHIGKTFILYVGDVNWNKNVPGLIRAFKILLDTTPGFTLVLCGGAFLNDDLTESVQIRELIKSLAIEQHVAMPGHVSGEMLCALFESAKCLVFPAYYEGFGLPVIDALAHHCPVVTSGVSSLAEIAGPSVIVNPDDCGSIAQGIQKVLRMSESERKQMVFDGLKWAKRYSWKKTARETISVYERACT